MLFVCFVSEKYFCEITVGSIFYFAPFHHKYVIHCKLIFAMFVFFLDGFCKETLDFFLFNM